MTNELSRAALRELLEVPFEAGWTDGLPVIPPTRELVDEFVAASGRPADDAIAEIPPLYGAATIEKIAVNAVMAGCLPEYMPVVVTALSLAMQDQVSVGGMQCSTHMSTPLIIVHGPIRHEIGMNAGANTFGQGNRANATIGRAVHLALVNIGGSFPGEADKSTLGHPGKYTYCIAENEEDSPFDPLHVDRGLTKDTSAVTVYGCEGPHNINHQASRDPFAFLTCMADVMANLGSNHIYIQGESFVVLGPEHANDLADCGWKKPDIQQYLFENARRPLGDVKRGGIYGPEVERYNFFPRWIDKSDDNALVPVARRAQDITIIVAGGSGKHSAYLPGWGTRSATGPIL